MNKKTQIVETEKTPDDMDIWFNKLDEESMDIINKNLIMEDEISPDQITELSSTSISEPDSSETIIENIYVEDIILKNPEDLSTVQVIQYECSLVQFIQLLLDGNQHNKIKSFKNYDNIIEFEKLADILMYIKWINNATLILAGRIGQDLILYSHSKLNDSLIQDLSDPIVSHMPLLVRSSYNFCMKNTQCKNFYNKSKQPTCKDHHYVHSILKYDTDSLINYIEYVLENNIVLTHEQLSDINLSIKTIGFVTRHMAKEICFVDYFTKNNSETFHRNNPISMIRKHSYDNGNTHNTNWVKKNNYNKHTDTVRVESRNTPASHQYPSGYSNKPADRNTTSFGDGPNQNAFRNDFRPRMGPAQSHAKNSHYDNDSHFKNPRSSNPQDVPFDNHRNQNSKMRGGFVPSNQIQLKKTVYPVNRYEVLK